jgi:cystathionine beta-lyase/cystathionine gamma-synthase
MSLERGRSSGLSTTCVHGGDHHDGATGAAVTPIFQTSTFHYMKGPIDENYVYTRWRNPTTEALERKVALLEGTEAALAFSSGMAAITTSLTSVVGRGDHLLAQRNLYGAAFEFITRNLPALGVEVEVVDHGDLGGLDERFRPNTKAVYIESPTNPLVRIVDFHAVAKAAHRHNALVLMDSTFGTPINQNPHGAGVDIVLHSATKYLNGHTDLIAGVAATTDAMAKRLWDGRKVYGGIMDPLQSFLLLRGMKTLALRMRAHNENGQAVAEFLQDHSRVDRVYYPGLKDHPDHGLARKLMRGFGGMVSFEVKGGLAEAETVLKKLRVIKVAPSLGGVDSLTSMPVHTSHLFLAPEERRQAGIKDNLVRLSLGVEDSEDLKVDLENALGA